MTWFFGDRVVGLQLITEQAALSLPRGAQIAGTCGSSEAELHVSWSNNAYTFRLYFSKVRKSKLPASVSHRVRNSAVINIMDTHSGGVGYKVVWICALGEMRPHCARARLCARVQMCGCGHAFIP